MFVEIVVTFSYSSDGKPQSTERKPYLGKSELFWAKVIII